MFRLFSKIEISTNPEKVRELLSRSVSVIYPNKEEFEKKLLSGKQMRVYVGIDPTAPYVHLGHATNYLVLKRFHELGHKIIVLIGDFTAMVGDPSDKTALRKRLTKNEVVQNLKTFKSQIGKILDFNNIKNPIEIKFNSKWLSPLTFKDTIDLASHFTVQQMIERDVFEKRILEKKPLYVHEFFYPLMQGYDSVALTADAEVGGTDQTFNMLTGRTLVKNYQKRDKFVLVTNLLENPTTGEKLMSKSLGTGIGLNESSNEMFGKVMALPDQVMIQMFTDCTNISMGEIQQKEQSIKNGANPRDLKIELAYEIVKMYHSVVLADEAKQNFIKTFSKKEIPEDVTEFFANVGDFLGDLVSRAGLVKSKTEFRRLVEEGAVHNMGKNLVITDPSYKIEYSGVFKIGKRRFLRIKLK